MKKLFISFSAVILFCSTLVMAQNNVVLQSNGVSTVFNSTTPLVDAYEAAINGDTIYLPGVEVTAPTTFGKQLTVFGAGYDPGSTGATGRSILTSLNIGAGADGSHFEGFQVKNNVNFAGNTRIDNVSLTRLHINGNINITTTESLPDKSRNILIRESVFNQIDGSNTDNIQIHNCFINNYIVNVSNGWIANNTSITLYRNINNINHSLIENNIIIPTIDNTSSSYYSVYNSSYNTFKNNVFRRDPTIQENNTWENNFTNVDYTTLFIDFAATYNFEADYHLVNPGLHPGTTGNQVGIYGGIQPFKENASPRIPLIISKNIAATADEAGNLLIDVTVEAQDE